MQNSTVRQREPATNRNPKGTNLVGFSAPPPGTELIVEMANYNSLPTPSEVQMDYLSFLLAQPDENNN